LNSIQEFVDYAATENRFNQAVEYVFTQSGIEPSIEKTKLFINWINNDIVKEEIYVLANSGLEFKNVVGLISKRSASWFISRHVNNI
jgi:hypothetical protein